LKSKINESVLKLQQNTSENHDFHNQSNIQSNQPNTNNQVQQIVLPTQDFYQQYNNI